MIRARTAVAALLTLAVLVPSLVFPIPSAGAQATTAISDSPWFEMCRQEPCGQDPALPSDETGRHMRIRLAVQVPSGTNAADLAATHTVDLAEVLRSSDLMDGFPDGYPHDPQSGILQGFELLPDSFTLVEVDASGEAVGERIPLQVFGTDAIDFDAHTNPEVTLRWIMPGATEGTRHFDLYFDVDHNGDRESASFDDSLLGRIATAVGPGRGTRFFVPLPGVAASAGDPRSLVVTNLQDAAVNVDVRRYVSGNPAAVPLSQAIDDPIDVPAGVGSTATFQYDSDYRSRGTLLLEADGLVAVEAAHRGTLSGYTPGTSALFLPALDGGFVGTHFATTPPADGQWAIYCHEVTLPEDQEKCSVTVPGKTLSIHAGDVVVQNVQGQPVQVTADVGRIAVQRIPQSNELRPPTAWPALDGPLSGTTFMGHTKSTDTFLLSTPATTLHVQGDLTGGKRVLAETWQIEKPGLVQDPPIGVSWGVHEWFDKDGERIEHQDGPLLIEPSASDAGQLGIRLVNGYIDRNNLDGFGALVPLQSPDGGLHYEFHIPGDPHSGSALGRLVVFAPHESTRISFADPAATTDSVVVPANGYVDTRERFPTLRAGKWSVAADRPVVAAWLKEGTEPMAAFAPAVTDLASVSVVGAQASGYMFDAQPDKRLQNVQAGGEVTFQIALKNQARDVRGELLPDSVRLELQAPSDAWNVVPRFATVSLEPGGSGSVTFTAEVPTSVGSASGAVLRLIAQSTNGGFSAETDLLVNYLKPRGVEVAADTQFTSKLTKPVQHEGPPGSNQTTFTVSVRNTGATSDAFEVVFPRSDDEWIVDVDPRFEPRPHGEACPRIGEPHDGTPDGGRTPMLEPLEHVDYEVNVTLRGDADRAFRHLGVVTAASISDCSAVDSVQLVTQVQSERDFAMDVVDPERVVEPGSATTFHLDVRNDAEDPEDLEVSLGGTRPDGWAAPVVVVHEFGPDEPGLPLDPENPRITIDPGQTKRVSLTRAVPADAAPLTLAVDRVRLESSAGPAREVELRTVAARQLGFQVHSEPATLALSPGSGATLDLVIDSDGNVDQEIRIEATASDGKAWSFRDTQDAPPPWNITLPADGQARIPVRLHAPADAPAATQAPRTLASVHMIVPGLPVATLDVDGTIDARPAAELTRVEDTLDPGRASEVPVAVRNTGNVPLEVDGQWRGLPEAWRVQVPSATVGVGESVVLRARVTVPHDEAPAVHDASFFLRHASSDVAEASATLRVGDPALQVEADGAYALGDDRVYRLLISNGGDAPAFNVTASVLVDGREVDRFVMQEVLPGRSHVAALIGPADAGSAVLRVRADHDPDGTRSHWSDLASDAARDGRDAPQPPLAMLAAVLAAAVFAARGRRRP